jgi:hypothetical protein
MALSGVPILSNHLCHLYLANAALVRQHVQAGAQSKRARPQVFCRAAAILRCRSAAAVEGRASQLDARPSMPRILFARPSLSVRAVIGQGGPPCHPMFLLAAVALSPKR